MKKCPSCNAINADTDTSCGVCGGNLSEASSERLESLVHKETRLKGKKKLSLGSLALVIFSLATTVAGASLLFFNGLGVILLLVGLLAILLIFGGAGGPLKCGVAWQRRRSMTHGEEEIRSDREELQKRTGEED